MSTRIRLTPDQRKRMILDAALDHAIDRGLYHISMKSLSKSSKMTVHIIRHYFPTITVLRNAICSEARAAKERADHHGMQERFDDCSEIIEQHDAMETALGGD